MTEPVVIVGAGIAGWRVADGLAEHAPERRVIVLGAEKHAPYDRPPLSKQALLGVRPYDDLALGRASVGGDIDLRLGARVVSAEAGRIELSSGDSVAAGDVVWATGVVPIRPDWVPESPDVHVLRTIEDSRRLGERLDNAGSLVIIGGGFIGCEIAAAAVAMGVSVTVIEMADQLLPGAVHQDIGRLVRSLHEDNGVRIRLGEQVRSIETVSGGVEVVTDVDRYRADAVVVGIGARIDSSPLGDLPLDLGGIACDSLGRVEGRPGVWAVGDAAAWQDPILGARRRREHWTTATTQASIVAMSLAGVAVPDAVLRQPPYAWSDQYGLKVQVLGWPEAGDRSEWLDREGPTGALGYFAGEALAGVMTIGAPRLLMKHRAAITSFALAAG